MFRVNYTMENEFYGLLNQVDKAISFIILSYGNIIQLLLENSFCDLHFGKMLFSVHQGMKITDGHLKLYKCILKRESVWFCDSGMKKLVINNAAKF